MFQNMLYNFVKNQRTKVILALDGRLSITDDIDQRGASYVRFELPVSTAKVVYDERHSLTIRDHHISIYETEHRRIAELSQYHYTARYLDELGNLYQAHVYFDKHDSVVKEPVVKAIVSGGAGGDSLVPYESSSLNDLIEEEAIAHSKAIISALRRQQEECIREYQVRYNELEYRAFELAKSLHHDKAPYAMQLKEMQVLLELLIPLVPNQHYLAIHKFLQQIIVALTKPSTGTYSADEDSSPHVEDSSLSGTTAEVDTATTAIIPKAIIPTATPICSLDGSIDALVALYTAAEKGDETALAPLLTSTLNQIYVLSLQLTEEHTRVSLRALEALHQLHNQIQKKGEALFIRALLTVNMVALQELPNFYHLILEKHFIFALHTANHKLLDFVLTHGSLNVNKISPTIRGTSYPSAVHYCYEKHSSEESLVACLAVLVAHGASLHHPDRKGLSIAFNIISDTEHPLRKALTTAENKDKTFYSIEFFKKIRNAINGYLKKTGLPHEEHAAITHKLRIIENQLSALLFKATDPKITKADTLIINDCLPPSYLDRLRADEEVIAAIAAYHTIRAEYVSFLSPAKKKIQGLKSEAYTKSVIENVVANPCRTASFTFEIYKTRCLDQIRIHTEILRTEIALAPIIKELKKTIPDGKHRKKLAITGQKLLSDLLSLRKKLSTNTTTPSSTCTTAPPSDLAIKPMTEAAPDSEPSRKDKVTRRTSKIGRVIQLQGLFSSTPELAPLTPEAPCPAAIKSGT